MQKCGLRCMKQGMAVSMAVILAVTTLSCKTAAQSTEEQKMTNNTDTENLEVGIPVTFLMNTVSGEKANEDLVNAFNETYDGRYEVQVEWLAGDEADYRSKMKLLNSIDELPAIVTDVGFDSAFYELLKKNNRLVNLRPYIDSDEDWKNFYDQEFIKSCIEEDGAVFLAPLDNCFFYSGMFYNKELFEEAGISEFPDTWNDFFDVCQQLKDAGITPLSLHTMGTAWVPMLISTSYLASSANGYDFMQQTFPDSYDTEEFRDMMQMCKRLFEYTTPDAIDGDFDTAADHFYKEETAMIANGEWMIENFSNLSFVDEEFAEKIGFHSFPGNTIVGSSEMTAWVVSSGYDQEVIDGAVEFLKFRVRWVEEKNRDIMEEYKESSMNEVTKEYVEEVENAKKIVPNYQLKWNSIIQNEVFLNSLPRYLSGMISLDEFMVDMEDATEEYQLEQSAKE